MKIIIRNQAARSPLLRKGGVHEACKSKYPPKFDLDLQDAKQMWEDERKEYLRPCSISTQAAGTADNKWRS